MMDPALGNLLAAAFALLFASAAIHKLRDLAGFADAFAAYELLPAGAARLAWLLPLLELAVAAGVLLGDAARSGERGGQRAAAPVRRGHRREPAARAA